MADAQSGIPRRWSELAYAGTHLGPPAEDSTASSWPTFFLRRSPAGELVGPDGEPVAWEIVHPDTIDFGGEELAQVQNTLRTLTPLQVTQAEYWNSGVPTKQWTPIIDRLIDTYRVTALRASRLLAAVHGAVADSLSLCWHFKYLWQVPRPNQYDPDLATICCTPHHPSYPAGHAVVSGCAEAVLGHFFPPEADRLHELAEECAAARVYAGVHYPADGQQGLRLGRQVGRLVTDLLAGQSDSSPCLIDLPHTVDHHANLQPPPYRQALPFPRQRVCDSKLDPRQDPSAR